MSIQFRCRKIVGGKAEGVALVTNVPISFWGGIDPLTGEILDKESRECGKSIKDKIFVFPFGKGSSALSGRLSSMCRMRTGPKALVNTKLDSNLVLGALVSALPLVLIDEEIMHKIKTGDYLKVYADEEIIEVVGT
ncbi:MAG: DUF126 domain-containing protein [Candidatus Bathyarchaeia archaeon]